ncbi:hypothetical protein KAI36_00207 [Paenibacillus sp. S02]|nr:hypothetical protein KAI36_00207 [Paenibacillus sp. S02]
MRGIWSFLKIGGAFISCRLEDTGNTGKSPDVVAKAIYKPATDVLNRLRYSVREPSKRLYL